PFATAGAEEADVFHLHHLTPQHDTVARRWPDVPVVAHLHGTEIKFVEQTQARASLAGALGHTLATMADADVMSIDPSVLDAAQLDVLRPTRWPQWRHGEYWCDRLRAWAVAADHIVVVSPLDRDTAISTLDVAPESGTVVPNGVDIERFQPRHLEADARRALLRRWLVDEPQGWDESGLP